MRGAVCLPPGEQVQHEIDATALETEDTLGGPFDFVVFNYPHVGSDEGLQHSIQENQALLRQFLEGVPALLSDKGEVHVTLLNRCAPLAAAAPREVLSAWTDATLGEATLTVATKLAGIITLVVETNLE
jgi:hypothetical protein